MAGIVGYIGEATKQAPFPVGGFVSPDLQGWGNFPLLLYAASGPITESKSGTTGPHDRTLRVNNYPILGYSFWSFAQDYYSGVTLSPQSVNLQTISSETIVQFEAYNANLFPVYLSDAQILNDNGMTITGLTFPAFINTLQSKQFSVVVSTSGPALANATLVLNFTSPDSFSIEANIFGNRAVTLAQLPEVPVEESWQWMTNNLRSINGNEQRISVRGKMARNEQKNKIILTTESDIRKNKAILNSCKGRLWMAEWQYATLTTSLAPAATQAIVFDRAKTDVRPGEFCLIYVSATVSTIVQIAALQSYGADLSMPLTIDVPAGSTIVPGSPCLVDDGFGLSRPSVNNVATMNLNYRLQRVRDVLARPGNTATLSIFKNRPVLEQRPLADDEIREATQTGQTVFDNTTGIIENVTRWNYSKVQNNVVLKIKRYDVLSELDYWKKFFDETQGATRAFWMPTFRPDLYVLNLSSLSSFTVEGPEYAEKMFPMLSYRYLEIETAAGIHRCKVTNATSEGNSLLTIEPALPDSSWQVFKRISFLRPVRLADDEVKLEHYWQHTMISFNVIDAESHE
jgi:hypothetical protein